MNKHQAPINLSVLHTNTRHDSGPKHVAGTAEYIDDMIEPVGTMHGLSRAFDGCPMPRSSRWIFSAVLAAPGVVGV